MKNPFGAAAFVAWLDGQRGEEQPVQHEVKIRVSEELNEVIAWVAQTWQLRNKYDAYYLLFRFGRELETTERRRTKRTAPKFPRSDSYLTLNVSVDDIQYIRGLQRRKRRPSQTSVATRCVYISIARTRGIEHTSPQAPWWWSALARPETKRRIRKHYHKLAIKPLRDGRPRRTDFHHETYFDAHAPMLDEEKGIAFRRATVDIALNRGIERWEKKKKRRESNTATQRRVRTAAKERKRIQKLEASSHLIASRRPKLPE